MDSLRESLQEECLSLIVKNFEWYHALFKTSNNPLVAQCFEFLQRVFSETLLQRLKLLYDLKEEYLDLLINPHIRQLSLGGTDENLMPKLLEQLAAGNNVTILKLAFWSVPVDQYKQLISSVPKVEIIEIRDILYSDVLAEIGKKCPLLRVLKVANCDIGDDALMNLFCGVNGDSEIKYNLEQLDVAGTLVTHEGISFVLSHAPSLKVLDFFDVPSVLFEKHKSDLENNCIGKLKKYSLTSLTFSMWQSTMLETLKISTVLCPNITSLSITGLSTDEQLRLCSEFHHLRDINLFVGTYPVSFEAVTEFLKLRGRGLFSISFDIMCVPVEAIVEFCPKLRSLKLGHVTFQHLDKKKNLFSKAKLCNLRSLTITNAKFAVKEAGDSLKLILSNAKSLNSMNMSGCQGLTEHFFRSLMQSGLFRVHELNADRTDVTEASIMELMSHGILQKVWVVNCPNITEVEYCRLIECRDNTNNVEIILNDEFVDVDSDDNSFAMFDYDYASDDDVDYDGDVDDYDYRYEYPSDCEYNYGYCCDDFNDYDNEWDIPCDHSDHSDHNYSC